MKNPGLLSALLRARSFLIIISAALILVSYTVTALMQGNGNQRSNGGSSNQASDSTADFWQEVASASDVSSSVKQVEIQVRNSRAFTLNRSALEQALVAAPLEFTAAARQVALVIALPAPDGKFQRFTVVESPVMEPGLAAKHPDIKTYSGSGIDDPAANIRFDFTPLGFHASVRSPSGNWYIDPEMCVP